MSGNVSVELQAVTPLFLGGADPRSADVRLREPELRPTSVRGVLRWWLRALLGGSGWAGTKLDDSDRIWREEAAVFGSVTYKERDDGPELGGASPVLLQISDERPAGPPKSAQKNPNAGKGRIDGLDYLLFGMHESRGQGARQYFQPDTRFCLTLLPRPGAPDPEVPMRRAAAALWLLTMLGGLGARSRRGAGCLVPANPEGWADYQLPEPRVAANLTDLQENLRKGVSALRQAVAVSGYKDAAATQINPPASSFSIIHPNYLTIHVLDYTWDNWNNAMLDVGEWFALFRRDEVKSDSDAIIAYLDRNTPPPRIERAAFGLPLPFYFATKQPSRVEVKPQRREYDRSASPLMFHFSRLADGKIALVLIASYRELLPPREDMQVVGSGLRPARFAPPSADEFDALVGRLRDYIADSADADFLQVDNWRLPQ